MRRGNQKGGWRREEVTTDRDDGGRKGRKVGTIRNKPVRKQKYVRFTHGHFALLFGFGPP